MSAISPEEEDEAERSIDQFLSECEPLEELDDEEFGLPPVEHPPTLEEILADDEHIQLDEENDVLSCLSASEGDQPLVALGSAIADDLSIYSRGSSEVKSRSSAKGSVNYARKLCTGQSNLMRHVILRGISAQMTSARERANAGLPSVIAVSSAVSQVAIGTSHGFILVFDEFQKLKFSLGGTEYGREFGSVSSMAFNRIDSTIDPPSRLLVGFAKGHLVEFDLTSGKLLRKLDEVHPLGSAVLHVRFTDDHTLALMSNSGGSVFEIVFRRTFGVRGFKSRCIFSGSRGEVCTLEPLCLSSQHPTHPLSDRTLLAVATISKVIVLTLRPAMKVFFTHPLKGRSDSLPLLAWQFVTIQTSSTSQIVDPVLAFGRQSTLFFFQVTTNLSDKLQVIPLQKIEFSYELINFGWMNARCLAILDRAETFRLYDVKNKETLETLDLSDAQLCYGSSFFKGLATGGNVSAAMAAAGQVCSYGSFICASNQLLLLGRSAAHLLVIRSWHERLDHLIRENRYLECLALGAEFFTDQSKALVGLSGPSVKKRLLIGQKMTSILLKYLELSMTKFFPMEGDIKTLADYFSQAVPPCVHLCMVMKRKDLLFDHVWATFMVDPFGKASFLNCLESYILSDQLRNLPVPITQAFVSLYVEKEDLQALEVCLTHVNVSSIDIHQAMSVCLQHHLYDAVIYIQNKGMNDFVSPMEDLIFMLDEALKSQQGPTDVHIRLGNKLLVYISCCLAGRAYPYGDLEPEKVAQVKYDIYACLTILHSRNASDQQPSYPFLRILLSFDTQGLLNVISIAFEEPEFNTELGRCKKQRLVDILLQVMVEQDSGYSAAQVAYLFTFLARQIAKGDNCVSMKRTFFDEVLKVLSSPCDGLLREEREQALLDMLQAGGMQFFDRDHLIICSQGAGFYRILEMLYDTGGEFEKILRCYLDDPMRNLQSFNFVQRVFLEPELSASCVPAKKVAVEKAVINELDALLTLDAKKTVMLIYFHMYPYIPLVIEKLSKQLKLLYQFLKMALELNDNGSQPNSPGSKSSVQLKDDDVLAKTETLEQFVELMCCFDPKLVASFLRSRSGGDLTSKMLHSCRSHGLIDAQAFLLENNGQVDEAFELMVTDLNEKLEQFLALPHQDYEDHKDKVEWTKLDASVMLVIQFCQRASFRSADSAQNEKRWFNLLDCVMKHQESREGLRSLKGVVHHVVSSAMGSVNLRTLIEKIIRNPAYLSDQNFGDIRQFLVEMLEMYHYEEVLMLSTCSSVRADMYRQLVAAQALRNQALPANSVKCSLCHQHLARKFDVIVFQCGQTYHMSCLEKSGCLSGSGAWQCYECCVAKNVVESKCAPGSRLVTFLGPQPPDPKLMDEILNLRVSKAREYLSGYKTNRSMLSIMDSMKKMPDFLVNQDTSIFERPDFPLKLAPDPCLS